MGQSSWSKMSLNAREGPVRRLKAGRPTRGGKKKIQIKYRVVVTGTARSSHWGTNCDSWRTTPTGTRQSRQWAAADFWTNNGRMPNDPDKKVESSDEAKREEG